MSTPNFLSENSPGVLPLSTDGDAPLRFEKLTLRGTHFLKKVTQNGTEMPKFSQNFLLVFQNFPKKVPYEGLIFYFGVFATRPGTHEGEKRYSVQRSLPVPHFAQSTPGKNSRFKFYHYCEFLILCCSSQPKTKTRLITRI